jgi:hypothetical protein
MPSGIAFVVGGGCTTLLLQVALLVVALVVVRKASATAAYVLAAGAGFRILTSCCVDFGDTGLRMGGVYRDLSWDTLDLLSTVLRLAWVLDNLVFWVAVSIAGVLLARAVSAAAAADGGVHG